MSLRSALTITAWNWSRCRTSYWPSAFIFCCRCKFSFRRAFHLRWHCRSRRSCSSTRRRSLQSSWDCVSRMFEKWDALLFYAWAPAPDPGTYMARLIASLSWFSSCVWLRFSERICSSSVVSRRVFLARSAWLTSARAYRDVLNSPFSCSICCFCTVRC